MARSLPVAERLPAAIAANGLGLGLICPEACGPEAAWAGEAQILAPRSLIAVVNHFRGTQVMSPPKPGPMLDGAGAADLSDVKGQESAKRALEDQRQAAMATTCCLSARRARASR